MHGRYLQSTCLMLQFVDFIFDFACTSQLYMETASF